jgi:hypothetical protein
VIAGAMAFAAPALAEKYDAAVLSAEMTEVEYEGEPVETEADNAEVEETEETPAF